MDDIELTVIYPHELRPDLSSLGEFAEVLPPAPVDRNEFDEFDQDYHSAPAWMESATILLSTGAAVAGVRILRDIIVTYLKERKSHISVKLGDEEFTFHGRMSSEELNSTLTRLTRKSEDV